jgi:hypothetical protein
LDKKAGQGVARGNAMTSPEPSGTGTSHSWMVSPHDNDILSAAIAELTNAINFLADQMYAGFDELDAITLPESGF